jgi:four helix bundle protein
MMKSNYGFSFEKLDVYHKAINYGEHVHLQIQKFPKDELYSLSSQFRRAADSIALNISEGYPGSDKQFIRHLNIAIYKRMSVSLAVLNHLNEITLTLKEMKKT